MKQKFALTLGLLFLAGTTLHSFAAFIVPRNMVENPVTPDSKTFSSAFSEFTHLSRKERKSRIKDVKSEVKKFKTERREGSEPSTNQLLLVILAILLPPLAVYLHEGEINNKFWLDLILTLLGFLPGIIYALIVVLAK
ncbi:MAG: YqaE/Pmp3 family membrane protein [Bacteroidota bacterium]|nr:YqaE/Pmp3 family membrane protein [Bacteroidota bacterium]